jgi:endo-1,4-beta-xylanase
MSKHFSRRDFFKLSGVASAGMFLFACDAATKFLVPTQTPWPTSTPFPTATSTPTLTPSPTATNTPVPTPTNVPKYLRDFAGKLGLEIGVALGASQNQEIYQEVLTREFNFCVSEAFHWASDNDHPLRPSRHTFDFTHPDSAVAYAQQHSLPLQVHHLVWGNESVLPDWLKEGNFSKDDLLSIIEEHVTTIVSRYKGKVKEWTVVNEVLSPYDFWGRKLGVDSNWIGKVFGWAHDADPDAKLILSDSKIEIPGALAYNSAKNSEMLNLIQNLKSNDAPINGVGFQMHLSEKDFLTQTQLNIKSNALKQNIINYEALGVDVFATEFDLRIDGIPGSQEDRFALQGKAYGSLFKACLDGGLKSLCVYGLIDRDSWLENPSSGGAHAAYTQPLIFDDNYNPKPAYYAMLDVLQQYAK